MSKRMEHNPRGTEQPLPSLERSIEAHYQQMIPAMTETGLIHLLPEKEAMGAVVTDGLQVWECPVPKLETIQEVIRRESFAQEKYEQGFRLLQMTPLLTQQELIATLEAQLKRHASEGTLLGSDGTVLALETDRPVYLYDRFRDADINGSLRYYPSKLDRNTPGGMTKAELIKQSLTTPFPGWEVSLIEPGELPARGKGVATKGRTPIEAGRSLQECLRLQQTDRMYHHETGKTPESWLTEFLMRLHIKHQVLGDWQGVGRAEFLIGAYHPASGRVPFGYWYRDILQADLGAYFPAYVGDSAGVRSAVRIGWNHD